MDQNTNRQDPASSPNPESSTAKKTFRIPVSTGIFDHCLRIGGAIWLLLFCIDRTTEEVRMPDGRYTGRVLGGRPLRDAEVAAIFGCSTRTVMRWRRRLTRGGYIRSRRTPYGSVIEVVNSQKWPGGRLDKTASSEVTKTDRVMPKTSYGYAKNGNSSYRNRRNEEDYTNYTRQYRDRGAKAAFENPVPATLLALSRACDDAPASETQEERVPTPEERKELGRRLREEVEAHFGWNRPRYATPAARKPQPEPTSEEARMERANKMRIDFEAHWAGKPPRR